MVDWVTTRRPAAARKWTAEHVDIAVRRDNSPANAPRFKTPAGVLAKGTSPPTSGRRRQSRQRADRRRAGQPAPAPTSWRPATRCAGCCSTRSMPQVDFVSAIARRATRRAHYLLSGPRTSGPPRWAKGGGRHADAARGRRPLPPRRQTRDLITVSQWADRHRELRSGTNAPGPWHNALTPYLVDDHGRAVRSIPACAR